MIIEPQVGNTIEPQFGITVELQGQQDARKNIQTAPTQFDTIAHDYMIHTVATQF